jgi:hypothetical protein
MKMKVINLMEKIKMKTKKIKKIKIKLFKLLIKATKLLSKIPAQICLVIDFLLEKI